MIFLKILIILVNFLTAQVACREYFDLDQTRLKNGAFVVALTADWGSGTEVGSLLIKNGASLKFDRKTSFPALAFKFLDSRLQHLAKEYGFIVKGAYYWDYSNFIFYFPKGFLEKNSKTLWSTIFDHNEVDSIELENIKREILRALKKDLNRKFSRMSVLSLMSPNSSIYSLGMYGSEEDIKSITEKEFNDFLKSYVNPLGAIFVVTGLDNGPLDLVSKELEKKHPFFRDQRFNNEVVTTFNVPVRKINYARSGGNNSIVRLGFPAVSCTAKDSFVYDVLQQLLSDDHGFFALGRSLYVSNNCSLGGGTMEIIIGGLKQTDTGKILDFVFKRLLLLSKNIDEDSITLSKQKLIEKYNAVLSKRDDLVTFVSRASLLYGDPTFVFKYRERVNDVKISEVKKILSKLSEQNSYTVLIKLGS